ncbi:MAG: hypothetical protein ACK4E7_13270 [Permianibacter sp.]
MVFGNALWNSLVASQKHAANAADVKKLSSASQQDYADARELDYSHEEAMAHAQRSEQRRNGSGLTVSDGEYYDPNREAQVIAVRPVRNNLDALTAGVQAWNATAAVTAMMRQQYEQAKQGRDERGAAAWADARTRGIDKATEIINQANDFNKQQRLAIESTGRALRAKFDPIGDTLGEWKGGIKDWLVEAGTNGSMEGGAWGNTKHVLSGIGYTVTDVFMPGNGQELAMTLAGGAAAKPLAAGVQVLKKLPVLGADVVELAGDASGALLNGLRNVGDNFIERLSGGGSLSPQAGRIGSSSANRVAPGPVNFMGDADNFYKFSSRRADIDPNGQFDVVAHGSPDAIEFMTAKGPVTVDHRTAARLIQEAPGYNGQPIRLLSCETGACDVGFAQNLANKLNVPVQAPTDLVWAYQNGQMVVAPRLSLNPRVPEFYRPDLSNPGTFRTFTPGGNN